MYQPSRCLLGLLGPIELSFRALSGRLKFTVRRHKFNEDSLSSRSTTQRATTGFLLDGGGGGGGGRGRERERRAAQTVGYIGGCDREGGEIESPAVWMGGKSLCSPIFGQDSA